MSQRYVWDRYNIIKTEATATPVGNSNTQRSGNKVYNKYLHILYSDSYEIVDGKFQLVNPQIKTIGPATNRLNLSYGELSSYWVASHQFNSSVQNDLFYLNPVPTSTSTPPSMTSTFNYISKGLSSISITYFSEYDTTYPDTTIYLYSYNGSTITEGLYIANSKGTANGIYSSSSKSTYPTDNVSGQYWYTYKGSDNIDPTNITYPSTIRGGQSINLTASGGNNIYGGTITYMWEVSLSGGEWTSIGTSTTSTKSYVVPKGTTTFQARVKVKDNLGFTSTDHATGNKYSVINNTNPNISGEDKDLGTFRYEYPTISYIITDPDEQTVICKIELDSVIVAAEEAIILGQEYTYTVTEEQMAALADGVHTIKITATDSEGASAVRQYTFTKFFGSDTLYQRLRRLNDFGLYDTIYFENMASNIIRPNGMTVQETIDKIEADLAELEK